MKLFKSHLDPPGDSATPATTESQPAVKSEPHAATVKAERGATTVKAEPGAATPQPREGQSPAKAEDAPTKEREGISASKSEGVGSVSNRPKTAHGIEEEAAPRVRHEGNGMKQGENMPGVKSEQQRI